MDPIRVLIADDEPPAVAKVRRFLAADPEVEIVGEAASGPEAVEAIASFDPDLVFLDVQMPGLDGFGVLEALQGEELPEIVFVTAFDRYALDAFEVNAVDYLLKPFDAERFAIALERAKRRVREAAAGEIDARLRSVLVELRGRPEYLDRILVRTGDRAILLDLEQVAWIEAEQNYVRLHVREGRSHLVRGTLANLEKRLDPRLFLRIHRSSIVNATYVRELRPWSHGDFQVVLEDGTELTLSRRYRDRLPDPAL